MKPLLALLAMTLACAVAHAQDRAETLFNLVSLSAQAEREVANDTLTAVLAADAEGADPAALADTVNRTMREALKVAQGFRAVKARSLNYQTLPVYDKARIVRWRVRQELRLESQDFAQATELIGKLQASLQVASLAVGLSNEARKQAENGLIADALGAFHERAAIVRDAQKAKGYRVKELQVGTGGVQPRYFAAPRAAMASASGAPPAVEPGASVLQVNVSGTIQLQ
ncbi:MAG: SIMPL domain-containing protein [Proteobacteria bacterium]|nr:SIMPL domain-containing protein [Pseudomonadota bacterium]